MSAKLDAEWAAICEGVTKALSTKQATPIPTVVPTAILSGDAR